MQVVWTSMQHEEVLDPNQFMEQSSINVHPNYGETSSSRFCRVAVPNCAMMAATIRKASMIKKMTIGPVIVPREARTNSQKRPKTPACQRGLCQFTPGVA